MLRRTIRWLPLLGVALSMLASHALGQGDPLALQQQAIRRIDGFIEAFRKTGDMRSRIPDLAQAERELAASNQALAARGDWDALALGLIKQGHTQRMQSNWAPAIGLYSQAGEAARRAGNVVHQADALAWRALADSSRRNVGQAFTDASQAVRLAETAGDKDVLRARSTSWARSRSRRATSPAPRTRSIARSRSRRRRRTRWRSTSPISTAPTSTTTPG